jgi:hypothetical protein
LFGKNFLGMLARGRRRRKGGVTFDEEGRDQKKREDTDTVLVMRGGTKG